MATPRHCFLSTRDVDDDNSGNGDGYDKDDDDIGGDDDSKVSDIHASVSSDDDGATSPRSQRLTLPTRGHPRSPQTHCPPFSPDATDEENDDKDDHYDNNGYNDDNDDGEDEAEVDG